MRTLLFVVGTGLFFANSAISHAQLAYPHIPPQYRMHPHGPIPVLPMNNLPNWDFSQRTFLPPPAPIPVVYTMQNFKQTFVPVPGKHHIVIIHPVTCKPVEVCFTLPCDCRLKEIDINRRSIEFEYVGHRDVRLVFRLNGSVDVD